MTSNTPPNTPPSTQASATPKKIPYANKGNLREGSVGGHLTRLTIPMIWGILAIISFQLVDTYFISLLGKDSLAAISFTFPITYMIFSFTMGFGIAMSSVASRLIGAGETDTVKRVTGHGLILGLLIGGALAILGTIFHDSIFRAMGAEGEMLSMIREYMILWFAGSIFITVPLIGNAAIRAAGDTFTPALIMGVVALVNVVLDPLLIFGLWGFPEMGMKGAALATLIANAAAMCASIYVLYAKKKLLCLHEIKKFNLFGNSVKRLMFIALPAGLTNAIQPLVSAFILGMLAVHGTEAVAAFGVVNRIESFAFIILMALSVGMSPVIGQNWGAERFDRVNETLKLGIGFNFIWSAFIAVILALFAKPIIGLFTDDPEIIRVGVLFFWVVPASYACGNLIMGWASAFNAMGMPQRSVMMIFVKMVVLLIPASYIGNEMGGILGIFIAMAAVNVVSGLTFHILNARMCKAKQAACLNSIEP